jgi:N-acetylneuraminic acid mutarotase
MRVHRFVSLVALLGCACGSGEGAEHDNPAEASPAGGMTSESATSEGSASGAGDGASEAMDEADVTAGQSTDGSTTNEAEATSDEDDAQPTLGVDEEPGPRDEMDDATAQTSTPDESADGAMPADDSSTAEDTSDGASMGGEGTEAMGDDTSTTGDEEPDPGMADDTASDDGADDAPIDEAPTAQQPFGTPVEEEVAAVPTARGEHGVGALRGEVYVLGGFTPSVTDSVVVYTPETDSWRDVASFPVVFHHPNVASVGDRLYVLGHHAGSGQRVGDGGTYEYDPDADSWSPLTPMPPGTERGASCVTVYQDKIYVFGGTNDIALAEASTYDPATDTWEVLPFLPEPRHHCIAAVWNEKIYIVSGRDVVISEVHPRSFVFDPVAQTYEDVAPILTPRGGAAGGELGGRIYVFGGEGNTDDPRGIFHEAEVYDPVTDTWEALPDMNVPRHGFGAAVIGDRMYMPGGSTSQGIEAQTTHSVFYVEP